MIGRTNTGGGGGLSPNAAVIHVTAPVGSTISFSKGGVVAKILGPEKSHVNAADSTLADWFYAVSPNNYGTWTVEANVDNKSTARTVIVSANEQYDVGLFWLYLYDNGDKCIDTVGSWQTKGMKISSSSSTSAKVPTVTYGTTTVTYSINNGAGIWYAQNPVDVTKFKTLKVSFGTVSNNTYGHIHLSNNSPGAVSYFNDLGGQLDAFLQNNAIATCDVSNIYGKVYFSVFTSISSGTCSCVIHQITFES